MSDLYSQYASGTQFTAGAIVGSALGASGLNPVVDRLNSIAGSDYMLTGSSLFSSIGFGTNNIINMIGDLEGGSIYQINTENTVSGTLAKYYGTGILSGTSAEFHGTTNLKSENYRVATFASGTALRVVGSLLFTDIGSADYIKANVGFSSSTKTCQLILSGPFVSTTADVSGGTLTLSAGTGKMIEINPIHERRNVGNLNTYSVYYSEVSSSQGSQNTSRTSPSISTGKELVIFVAATGNDGDDDNAITTKSIHVRN